MGRMILAFMPALEIDKLYAGKELARFSDHTATTLAALHAKLEQDRSAGMAWSDAHFESGISSAAVPVFDFAGTPLGAINVSGPVNAFAEQGASHRDRRGAARRRPRDFPPLGMDRNRCYAAGGQAAGRGRPMRIRGSAREGRRVMDLGLQGKVAVVTGGTSGIGLATARLLLAEGAAVAICGRDQARLAAAKSTLLGNAAEKALLAMPCDVLDKDAVGRFAAAVEQWNGRCDILVNNAGPGAHVDLRGHHRRGLARGARAEILQPDLSGPRVQAAAGEERSRPRSWR